MPKLRGLIGGSGTTASTIFDAEETINWLVEHAQSGSTQNDQGALVPPAGYTRWSSAGGPVGSRGFLFAADTRFLAVIGARLVEFDSNGTATDRGAVGLDANPAILVYNGIGGQVGIASGGNIYVFTLATNALSAAVLSGGYTHLAFAGGYGFAFQVTTGKTFVGALNDFSTWDAGTFFQRSLFSDPAKAIFADENNFLWTLGTESCVFRDNAGTGTQPWIPRTRRFGPYGIASAFGLGLSAAGNFWVTRNAQGIGRFVVSGGGKPTPVGTYAIDAQIDKFAASTGISDAEVLVYDQGGHTTANVAFAAAQAANPTMPCTFNYDVEGKTWTKRGRWNAPAAKWELWAPRCHVIAFGKHLVGDRSTGTIWVLDPLSATEVDGTGIRRLRRTAHLNHELQRVPINRIELLADVGHGVPSGQGSDPKMVLRVSKDGGRTWGSERQAGTGRIGEYRKRIFWTQLGAPSDAVLEFSYSEPVPFAIVDGYVNNTAGQAAV